MASHQRVKQQEIDRRNEAGRKSETTVSPAKPKGKKPVQKKVRADGEETDHHWRVAFADRVKRRRQHLQYRIGNKTDCVKFQCAGSLARHLFVKSSVLVDHANDGRRKHRQSNRRWNGKQKCKPDPTSENSAELVHVTNGRAFRYQRQSNGSN